MRGGCDRREPQLKKPPWNKRHAPNPKSTARRGVSSGRRGRVLKDGKVSRKNKKKNPGPNFKTESSEMKAGGRENPSISLGVVEKKKIHRKDRLNAGWGRENIGHCRGPGGREGQNRDPRKGPRRESGVHKG